MDAVLVGLDTNFSYSRLARAHRAITNGAAFFATNKDPALPTLPYSLPGSPARSTLPSLLHVVLQVRVHAWPPLRRHASAPRRL